MERACRAALFAAIWSSLSASGVARAQEAGDVAAADWRQPGRCGTNCLYALFHLLDRPVDYERLAADVPMDPVNGSSLADLQQAAERHGLRTEVRQVQPDELLALPTPFILHLELADVGGAGHFLAVHQVRKSQPPPGSEAESRVVVVYVDGGTGLFTRQRLTVVAPRMTGFALVVPELAKSPWRKLGDVSPWVAVLVGLAVGAPLAALVWRRAARRSAAR